MNYAFHISSSINFLKKQDYYIFQPIEEIKQMKILNFITNIMILTGIFICWGRIT